MNDAIGGVNGFHNRALTGPAATHMPLGSPPAGSVNFQDLLVKSLEQTNQLNLEAQTAIEGGLVGNDLTQVEIFTAVKKADLALRTMLQIRNKVLDAYNEVQQMRM